MKTDVWGWMNFLQNHLTNKCILICNRIEATSTKIWLDHVLLRIVLCYPFEKVTTDFDNNVLRFYNGFAADPIGIE